MQDEPEGRDAAPSLPTSPTGRTPQWVVEEALGAGPPRPWPGSADVVLPRRRRRAAGRFLTAGLVAGLLAAAAALVVPRPWPWEVWSAGALLPSVPQESPPPSVPVPSRPTDRPPPGVGAGPVPLGRPADPPAQSGAHAFASFQVDGVTPVAYDPCRPVHYVLRPDQAPPGTEELVHDAVARVAEVTGLRFVFDGPTDEAPGQERPVFQPDRYGDRWAPVLVAWETEEQNAGLAGDFVGLGGSTAVSLGEGPRAYVTGSVVLDAGQMSSILARPDGEAAVRAVVLHELAHLVGLGHVDDAGQLMHPQTRIDRTDFAAGDLAGLARLGRGECVPEL